MNKAGLFGVALLVALLPASFDLPVISAQGVGGGATLTGRVTLLLPPKVALDPGGSVVWIPGLKVASSPAPPPIVTSKGKRFDPRVLAIPSGTKVTFPNVDPIYHNAFSLSPGNKFDMGLYRKGASRDVILKTPGIVRVYCNIHPDMAASVVVVDGNAFSVVQQDGTYRIAGIPPGRYEVHIWSDVAGQQVVPMTFAAGQAVDWSPALDATKYRRVAHANKHGKAYPKAKNDADRY